MTVNESDRTPETEAPTAEPAAWMPEGWEAAPDGMRRGGELAIRGLHVSMPDRETVRVASTDGALARTEPLPEGAQAPGGIARWAAALVEAEGATWEGTEGLDRFGEDAERALAPVGGRSVLDIAGLDVGGPEVRDVLLALIQYMQIDDVDAPLVVMASAVSVALDEGEPLWVQLVGASSGGKTENIRLIDGAAYERLQDLTLAGLLTVSQDKKTKGQPMGLLTQIDGRRDALVTISDFSSLLGDAHSGTAKHEVFNALRTVYDGEFSRTMNGGTATWRGRLTLLAACTPAIDRFASHADSLGTRWLYFRLPTRDAETRRLVSKMSRGRKDLRGKRAAAADAADRAVRAGRDAAPGVALDERMLDLVTDCAMVATYGRADVPRDQSLRYEISDVVEPEEPGRATHQLQLLARSLVALGARREAVERILRKVGLASMPGARSAVLRALAAEGAPTSTNGLARLTGLSHKGANRAAEDLAAIGLVEGAAPASPTESKAWGLSPEHRDLVLRLAR